MQYDIAYLRGHGNGDKGAIGNNRTEYDMCQDRVNRVVKYLQAGGMKVFTNSPSQNNFETNVGEYTTAGSFSFSESMKE